MRPPPASLPPTIPGPSSYILGTPTFRPPSCPQHRQIPDNSSTPRTAIPRPRTDQRTQKPHRPPQTNLQTQSLGRLSNDPRTDSPEMPNHRSLDDRHKHQHSGGNRSTAINQSAKAPLQTKEEPKARSIPAPRIFRFAGRSSGTPSCVHCRSSINCGSLEAARNLLQTHWTEFRQKLALK